MKRPAVLIVGAVAGALIVAAVGASAHTGLFNTHMTGLNSAAAGDEATGARTETPEPSETPETEPTEAPEAADTDTDENDDSQGDNDNQGESTTGSGEHESGGTGSPAGREPGD